jgi:hypothetical protein
LYNHFVSINVVKGHVRRGGQPIEAVSAFYFGHFTNYGNTFEAAQEPNYAATLEIDMGVGVLSRMFQYLEALCLRPAQDLDQGRKCRFSEG